MRDRPNILFLLTDDQAAWTLGAEGNPNAHTPALDRLAGDGARFERMFANAAICSPARAALITGRYPSEVGFGPDGRVWLVDQERHLDTGAPTWPQALRDHGYRTALIGKWHLGHETEDQRPTRRGYERFQGFPTGPGRSRDPEVEMDGRPVLFEGEFTSDVLADLAINTIRQWRDEPFAVSLHFWAPHANTRFPEGYHPSYQDRSWLPMKDEDLAPWRDRALQIPDQDFPNLDIERVDRMTREYHASVHSVDRNVQRVLEALDALGMTENTAVVFASDQGFHMGHHGIWHKGNGRWITRDRRDPDGIYPGEERPNLYDHSLRVPCIVRWPARIVPGTVIPQPASFVDWFPTLLEMTGCPSSDGAPSGEGRSLLPLLEGRKPGRWDDRVFAQHDRLRCCRTSEWKYILNALPDQPDELYDLREDPGEHRNLLAGGELNADGTANMERLRAELLSWMRAIRDPLLTELDGDFS